MSEDNKHANKEEHKPYEPKTEEFSLFAQFCGMPKAERQRVFGYRTQKDFAKDNGVEESTLTRWKKQGKFWELSQKHSIAWGKEKMSEVLGGLYNRSIKGYASEVELWLAYVMGWDKKQVLEHRGNIELTENDLFSLIKILPEDEQRQFTDTFTKLLASAISRRDAGGHEEANSDGLGDNKENVQPPANNVSKDIQSKDKVASEVKKDIR